MTIVGMMDWMQKTCTNRHLPSADLFSRIFYLASVELWIELVQ